MTHLGVIGTGYWGENHARVCRELLDEELIDALSLCDTAADRVSEMAKRYDVPFTTEHTDLLDEDVDAAIVSTPSATHHQIGIELLENGVDLLIEKPLAMSVENASDLVETARANESTLSTGHIFRYHSAFRELEHRINRGELGEIRHVVTNRYSFRTPRRLAGATHSLAIHDLDLYCLLFGRLPDHLYCETTGFIRDDVDETASITLSLGDATGVINVSWQIPVFGKRRDVIVVGSKRVAYVDYTQETRIELYDAETFTDESGRFLSRENGSIQIQTDQYEPLRREVEDFLAAREDDTAPVASGDVGANAVYLVDRALDSAEAGERKSCTDPPYAGIY